MINDETDTQHESPPKYVSLTLLHLEWPKLYGVLTVLSVTGLKDYSNGVG